MSVSAAAPTPTYIDPERLVPFMPSDRADTAAAARDREQHLSMFAEGDDSPSFWDVLDVINPLQHIPVVNKIYQELTGDKIGVGARVVGGALFGGPLGLIASAIDCAIEEETGKDAGGHLLALFDDDAGVPPTALAEAKPDTAKTAEPAPAPAAVPAAPTIALPDVPAKPASAGALMFTSDGTLATPAAAIDPAPASRPLPLANAPARFMPVPQRGTAPTMANAPPPISVPVSNSGIRSNVPITGRDPVANAPNAMAVQKAMAAQGLGGVEHPMLPPAAMASPQAAAPQAGATADWFSAMGKALDKYERANSLAARPAPTQVTVQ